MKRSLHTTFILGLIMFFGTGQSVFPQVSLPHYEGLEYTTGSALQTQAGWTANNSGDDLLISEGSLSYPGYVTSKGNRVIFNGSGIDAYKSIDSRSTGTIYFSFIIKVTDVTAATNADGGYFTGFGQSTTVFGATVWLKKNGSNFNIGINPRTTVAANVYSTEAFSVNTEILIVASYQFNGTAGDDVVSLWINPPSASFGSTTVPSPTITATNTGGTDLTSISSVFVRQDSESETPFIEMDELRVSDSWADATQADIHAPVATLAPANAAVDVAPDVQPTITFDEPVLKTDGTVLADADLASLVTFRKTDAAGENVPFTATIDAEKKVITVTPSSALLNSQIYYLAVGSVEDANGNESTASGVTFTTLASTAGTVTITGPVGGETFHAGDATSITWTSANVTDIFIEVWSPTAGIYSWSSFVPTTPAAAGKADITVPADAPYGVEYKIRVSDKSNAAVSSESGAFTVIGVATTITDLRTRFADKDVVKLSGEATVTFLRPANRNQKYIQDANAGLLIDDASGVLTTVVAAGDKIEGLEGKIAFYGGVMEIVPTVATVTIKSGGNSVTIPELTIAQYLTDFLKYESMVIKLKAVTIAEGNGTATFAESTNYNVTDGTSTVVLRTFKSGDGNVVGTVIPSAKMHLTALAGFYNTTVQVYPMNTSDFYLLSSDKAITAFAFNGLTPAVTGTINEAAKTIALTVPASTNRTSLVPTIAVSDKSTVDPASGTAKDFTNPVTYTVTAEDGSTAVYTVTVSLSTGVSDAVAGQYRIYPVPAHSEVTATGIEDVKRIEIFDVTGNKLITVICEGENLKVIPVSQLVRGVYFIKFTTPQGAVMKRFVKE